MPIAVRRFRFHNSTDGWSIAVQRTDQPAGHTSADGSPEPGCLWIRAVESAYPSNAWTIDATSLAEFFGIPQSARVTRMRATYRARCSTYTGGDPTSYYSAIYGQKQDSTIVFATATPRQVSGTFAWTAHDDPWYDVDFPATLWLRFVLAANPKTNTSSGSIVELLFDTIEIACEYSLTGVITRRWSFASDTEGWQLETGGATGITSGWTAGDNAPTDTAGTGCLWVARTGQNLTDGYIRWRRDLRATDIGVPPQAIVTRMRVTCWARCAVYSTGNPSSITATPYVYLPGVGLIYSTGEYRAYASTSTWAQHLDQWRAVTLLPDQQVSIYIEAMPRTGNAPGAQVELRVDAIEISCEYVLPDSEPSGDPTVIVSGRDISRHVEAGSLRLRRAANGVAGECSMSLLVDGWADPLGSILEAGTDISVTIGTRPVFAGEITRVVVSSRGGHVRYGITCRDAVGKLARTLVPYLAVSSTTVGAIVGTIVSSYCAGIISTDTSAISDDRAVPSLTIEARSVLEALSQVAAEYPAAWYIDVHGVLHWRPVGTLEHSGRRYSVAPGVYDDGQAFDSVSFDTDLASLANRVTVRASYDTQTTGTTTAEPSSSGDDGYLSGSSTTTWPVPAASSADTAGGVLRVRGANTVPQTQMIISFATRARSGKRGNAWPPTTAFTPADNYVLAAQWALPPFYELQCQGFWFDIPENLTGISRIELLVTVSDVVNNPNDTQNTIWVELTYQSYYGVAQAEPELYWVGIQLTAGTHVISMPLEQAGSSVFYRIGLRTGAPYGLNQAQITNVQMRITHDDPAAAAYEESRALLRFDTSSLPDTATLTSAVLRLYCTAITGAWVPQIEVRAISPTRWPIDTMDWDETGGTVLATLAATSISGGRWTEISIPVSAIAVAGYTAFAVRIAPGQTPGSYQECRIDWASYDAGTNRPQLVVQYTTTTPGVAATVEDTASQAVYGVRELSLYRQGWSQDDCAELARTELARRAWPAQQVDYAAYAGSGVYPGQMVYVNLAPVLDAAHLLVTGLSLVLEAGGMLRYQLSCIGRLRRLEDLIMEALR